MNTEAKHPEVVTWNPSTINFLIGDKCRADCLICWRGLVAKSLDPIKFPACVRCERKGW